MTTLTDIPVTLFPTAADMIATDGAGHFMKFTDKNGVDLFLQKLPDGITVMVAADFKN